MKGRGFGDKTLWIITSEHGEGLCNHGHFYHGGRINNEQLHVPLLLHFPSSDFAYTTEKIVEHVDVAPTAAELVGSSFEKQIKPIQGTSLLTFLDGDSNLFPDKYAFSHRLHMLEDAEGFHEMRIGNFKYILNKDGSEQFFDVSVNPPRNIIDDPKYSYYKDILKKEVASQYEKFSLQDRKYKYILRKKGNDELYDIANDPYELKNIINNDSLNAIKDAFKSEILDRVSSFSQGSSGEESPLTEDLMDKLESAGYIK